VTAELRVIGAGLPRTGTYSLRHALERLIGGTCYHMSTLWEREGKDLPAFRAAAHGDPVDWSAVFTDCTAAVDWPAAALWRQLADRYPHALILLSERADPEQWWRSADATVWTALRRAAAERGSLDPTELMFLDMSEALMVSVFGPDWTDADAAKRGYESWNADVRASVPPERLVVWQPGMGWGPLCAALGIEPPDEPFPHVNTTEEFLARIEG
jgi:hypothetical protein